MGWSETQYDDALDQQMDELTKLRAERGRFILALEQIRSARHISESWRQSYERCVRIANAALNPPA